MWSRSFGRPAESILMRHTPARRAVSPKSKHISHYMIFSSWTLVVVLSLLSDVAISAPLRIVAIGASNTSGWLIRSRSAYPAVLQDMLRARGIEAEIINAGVPFDTTAKMLARLDAAVPRGTRIVILQPGGNDLRFFGSRQQRTANIDEMTRRLHARRIAVIVYDEPLPKEHLFDGIHLTPTGHRLIADALLPRVVDVIKNQKTYP